jgi:hypothetical protein
MASTYPTRSPFIIELDLGTKGALVKKSDATPGDVDISNKIHIA